jgi:hypothetical protein
MANNTSIYGSTPPTGTVSSSNYTTLYSGGNNFVPSGDNVIISGTLTVNGCSILTDCSSFNLLPFNATTIDFGNSATAISIGGSTGVTTIQNQLATGNYLFPLADGTADQILATDGSGILYWADVQSLDTNYSIQADTTTGGANLTLVGSDSTTDSVKFADGTGVTVVRTDANTITTSIGQDVATTATPTFAGATLGNITIAVATDNTITTTTGDLLLDSASGTIEMDGIVNIKGDYLNLNSDNSAVDSAMRFNASAEILYNYADSQFEISKGINVDNGTLFVDATNNRVGINNSNPEFELHIDQGLDGFTQLGMSSIERTALFTLNDGDDLFSLSYGFPAGNNRLQFSPTDQWFNLGKLGVGTNAPAYTLDVAGDAKISTDITIGNILRLNGATSGYTTFIANPTGATINYSLPAAQGAANTVLTNDGVGNLTWALPGGGGSTFGNVTVGVATDNTISTTTGDLILDSSSGTIALNVPTITTDQTTVSIFPTTTTEITLGGSTTTTNVAKLDIDNVSSFDTATITTTSTATTTLYATTRNAMTGLVNIKQGSNVHCVNFTVLRVDATTAFLTTYAEMYNNISLANLTADVSGGGMRLRVTPTSATSTVFYGVRTSLD